MTRKFEKGNDIGPRFEPGNDIGPRFEPGNDLAVKHGAYSERIVEPLAERLIERTLAQEHLAYLRDPSYASALVAWAQAEARIAVLDAHVAKVGMLDRRNRPTPAALLLDRLEARAMSHRKRLGLDPLSRAALGRDIAAMKSFDLSRVMADLDAEEEGG